MKTISTLLCVFLLAATPSARAAEAPALTVAVFDFTDNVGAVTGRDITALVTANLSAAPELVLVERAQLTKALGEQALGLSGNVNFQAAAQVGQLTGAKVLISGRAIKNQSRTEIVIVANLIGTETSRVISQTVQGSPTNLFTLTASLCEKLVQTLTLQSSNFIARIEPAREKTIDALIAKYKGAPNRSVSIKISERIPRERGPHQTAQNELGLILQKVGFTLLDAQSDRQPDVIITGSAMSAGGQKNGSLCTCRATLDIKAQERTTGKYIAVERQESSATDISRQIAARQALAKAADELAGRLLPLLAEKSDAR